MALLNDLSRKLSQTGQTAVQKAKEMADISKINGVILEEEKKITQCYCEIGKLYVTLHPADYEDDFAGLITEINDSKQKVSLYQQQIQEIKGIVRCEKCGAEVMSNAAFCSSCGTAIPQKGQSEEEYIECTDCGAMIEKNMKFCTGCGKPVKDLLQIKESEKFIESENKETVKKCPKCGVEITEDIAFCMECGTKL